MYVRDAHGNRGMRDGEPYVYTLYTIYTCTHYRMSFNLLLLYYYLLILMSYAIPPYHHTIVPGDEIRRAPEASRYIHYIYTIHVYATISMPYAIYSYTHILKYPYTYIHTCRSHAALLLLLLRGTQGRTGKCHVIELHKMRLFIYIPWTKSGLLTLFTYTPTGLFAI
jgi:hypothetical protein